MIYGKLLLNLNNALNAVTDLPIKQQLSHYKNRRILAKAMKEWLAVCEAADIQFHQYTKVKPSWLPTILLLPNVLFTFLANQMFYIDPKALSSMWEGITGKRKNRTTKRKENTQKKKIKQKKKDTKTQIKNKNKTIETYILHYILQICYVNN